MALVAVTGVIVQFAAILLARHRAEAAADLGALAGAAVVLQGAQHACDRAAAITRANGAGVSSCVIEGADLLLTVEVAVHLGPLVAAAAGRARAGPVATQTQ